MNTVLNTRQLRFLKERVADITTVLDYVHFDVLSPFAGQTVADAIKRRRSFEAWVDHKGRVSLYTTQGICFGTFERRDGK